MSYLTSVLVLAIAYFVTTTSAISLDINDQASIKNAATSAATGLMSHYKNGGADADPFLKGRFYPRPNYWWNSGAIWGAMIDYSTYTGDQQYVGAIGEALLANTGDYQAFMRSDLKAQMGNDDQLFWILTAMSAAKANLPQPEGATISWEQLAVNGWNDVRARWNTETCNGGYKWQHYEENAGYYYKNAINNGAMFQLSALLASHTGNETYMQHAEEIWDWSINSYLVNRQTYAVNDGLDDKPGSNCGSVDVKGWLYNNGVYLYGTATMFKVTGDQKWADRASGLLKNAQNQWFPNGIMSETACEQEGKSCNEDQTTHKGLWSRWAGKTAILVPQTAAAIKGLLETAAEAAAKSCTGTGDVCGLKWTAGSFDSSTGPNQQMSAMEVFQALLPLGSFSETPAAVTTVAESPKPAAPTTEPAQKPTTFANDKPEASTQGPVLIETSSLQATVPSTTAAVEPDASCSALVPYGTSIAQTVPSTPAFTFQPTDATPPVTAISSAQAVPTFDAACVLTTLTLTYTESSALPSKPPVGSPQSALAVLPTPAIPNTPANTSSPSPPLFTGAAARPKDNIRNVVGFAGLIAAAALI